MYKYKHGVQVTALGIVVAPISRSQKKKKIDASSLLSIFVVDDPSRQDVTIIIKRSTAP